MPVIKIAENNRKQVQAPAPYVAAKEKHEFLGAGRTTYRDRRASQRGLKKVKHADTESKDSLSQGSIQYASGNASNNNIMRRSQGLESSESDVM